MATADYLLCAQVNSNRGDIINTLKGLWNKKKTSDNDKMLREDISTKVAKKSKCWGKSKNFDVQITMLGKKGPNVKKEFKILKVSWPVMIRVTFFTSCLGCINQGHDLSWI